MNHWLQINLQIEVQLIVLSDKFFLLLLFLQMIFKKFWLFIFPNNFEIGRLIWTNIILSSEFLFVFLLEIIWDQEEGNHLVYSEVKFYMYLKNNYFY